MPRISESDMEFIKKNLPKDLQDKFYRHKL